jgi:uncharacterized protein (TIGR03118 family)
MRMLGKLNRAASAGVMLSYCFFLGAARGQDQNQHYMVTPLVSSVAGQAPVTDPTLKNAWGLSRSSSSPWWVSDDLAGTAKLYTGQGATIPLVVTIPSANGKSIGSPTGTIFNGNAKAFYLQGSNAALFLFATADGTLSGWNQTAGTTAVVVVNSKGKDSFTGLTTGTTDRDDAASVVYLYVADFHNEMVRVYDSGFHEVKWLEDAFNRRGGDGDGDSDTWRLKGLSPFNVQNIGGDIYVTYAKPDAVRILNVPGPGLGAVAVYTPEGKLLHLLQSGPWMNSPWGLSMASSDFGAYSHDILVGNFGSGWIDAFDPLTGQHLGTLEDAKGDPIYIAGLWALSPGNDSKAGNATSIYFSAGPNKNLAGLFGTITPVENESGNDQ